MTVRANRQHNVHYQLPSKVSGYSLDAKGSFWSVIVPEETTNMLYNPSFELATNNVVAFGGGGAIARTKDAGIGQIAGRYVLEVTITGANSGVRAELPHNAVEGVHTFSAWVWTEAGQWFRLVMSQSATRLTSVIASRTVTAQYTGWHRYDVSGNVPDGATAHIWCWIDFDSQTSTKGAIYTDAWQLEQKAYATTYCDGDQIGFEEEHSANSYVWQGVPHESDSMRSVFTRSGGRIYDFYDDINFETTSIVGLGISAIEQDVLTLADGRQIHRGARFSTREFTITGTLFADSLAELSAKKNTLIQYLRPDTTFNKQPLLMYYTPINNDGVEIAAPLEIRAAYTGGMEGGVTNFYQESIALQYQSSMPQIRSIVLQYSDIEFRQSWTNPGFLFRHNGYLDKSTPQEVAGMWDEYTPGVANSTVFGSHFDPNSQNVALVGAFTGVWGQAGLVGSIIHLVESDTFIDLSGDPSPAGAFNTSPFYMAWGLGPRAHDIAMIGAFTVKGATPMRRAAIWTNGTNTWAEMATGLNTASVGKIVAVGTGDFYCFGTFTADAAASITLNRCARYDESGDVWVQMEAGANPGVDDTPYDAILGKDGYIYFCGAFVNSISGTVLNGVAQYDPWNDVINAMGDGIPTNLEGIRIAQAGDGTIYCLQGDGNGTETGTGTIYRWNGSTWVVHYVLESGAGVVIKDIAVDKFNTLHVVGQFWTAGQDVIPYNGTYIRVPNNAPIHGEVGYNVQEAVDVIDFIEIDRQNRISLATETPTGETLTATINNTVTNNGTAEAYPKIYVTGTGRLWQIENLTANTIISFSDEFVLQEDEIVTIDLSGELPRIYSNHREGLERYLLPGGNNLRSFRLLPGDNLIRSYLLDNVGATDLWMTWQESYWSIDYED